MTVTETIKPSENTLVYLLRVAEELFRETAESKAKNPPEDPIDTAENHARLADAVAWANKQLGGEPMTDPDERRRSSTSIRFEQLHTVERILHEVAGNVIREDTSVPTRFHGDLAGAVNEAVLRIKNDEALPE